MVCEGLSRGGLLAHVKSFCQALCYGFGAPALYQRGPVCGLRLLVFLIKTTAQDSVAYPTPSCTYLSPPVSAPSPYLFARRTRALYCTLWLPPARRTLPRRCPTCSPLARSITIRRATASAARPTGKWTSEPPRGRAPGRDQNILACLSFCVCISCVSIPMAPEGSVSTRQRK